MTWPRASQIPIPHGNAKPRDRAPPPSMIRKSGSRFSEKIMLKQMSSCRKRQQPRQIDRTVLSTCASSRSIAALVPSSGPFPWALPVPEDESAVPSELVPGVLKGWPVLGTWFNPVAGDPRLDDPRLGDPRPGDPRPGDPRPGDPMPCDAMPPCDPMPPRAKAAAGMQTQMAMQRTESFFMSKLPHRRKREGRSARSVSESQVGVAITNGDAPGFDIRGL
jgi:hypothetical protein